MSTLKGLNSVAKVVGQGTLSEFNKGSNWRSFAKKYGVRSFVLEANAMPAGDVDKSLIFMEVGLVLEHKSFVILLTISNVGVKIWTITLVRQLLGWKLSFDMVNQLVRKV